MSFFRIFYQQADTNCPVCMMSGSPADDDGTGRGDTWYPALSKEIDALKRKALETGLETRAEVRLHEETGSIRWEIGIKPSRDAQGWVTGLLGYIRHATEQGEDESPGCFQEPDRRLKVGTAEPEKTHKVLQQERAGRRGAEEMVQDSRTRYAELYENAADILFTVDPKGFFTSVSRTSLKCLGRHFPSGTCKNLSDVLTPKSTRTARFLMQKAMMLQSDLAEEQPWEFEALKEGGESVFLEVRARLIWKGDTIAGFEGIARDVTERKKVEEELNRLAKAVEQAAEIVVVTDRSGKIEYVNGAFCKITGYVKEEVVGRSLTFLAGRKEDEQRYRQMFDSPVAGTGTPGRVTNRKKDGSTYQAEASVSPVRDRTGKTINYVVVERDVTDEIRLEMQLRQAQKMEAIGTLAGGIAHDFNNILSAIIGFSEMSIEDLPEGDPNRYFSEQVLKAAIRGRDLIRQILTFSHKRDQDRMPVRLSSIVKEVRKFLRASLPSTIEIRIRCEDDESMIFASPTEMHQVLMNLCTNAFHAMREEGGVLSIAVEDGSPGASTFPEGNGKGKTHLKLSVSDTGSGMNRDVMERIFDPFFTTKGPGEGTGMGLSVVHGIVESHGGTITVRSVPGAGSTFDLYFPRVEAAQPATAQPEQMIPEGRECILLVDDEENIVEIERLMLERMGYRVVSTSDSLEALEIFRREPERFDLIITDQTMPHVTGADLSRECLSLRPDIPIVLCTGFSEMFTSDTAKKLGIREFLLKPVVRRDLAVTVRRALDEKTAGP